jgi:hypothetical protein
MGPAEQLRALGGARTVIQLLSSKHASQQKLAACVLAKCSSNKDVQLQLQQHAAALVQHLLATNDREVRLRLLYAASCLKDCVLRDISETWLIDALKLVLADQDEVAAIAVCYLLINQLSSNTIASQRAAEPDVIGLLFNMAAVGSLSQTCKATALATLYTLLRVSKQARELLNPEQIELLLALALDTAAADQLSATSKTASASANATATPSCPALAARCLICLLQTNSNCNEDVVAAVQLVREQLRLLRAAQRLLHCLSSQSSALRELAALTLADALAAPLQRVASASTAARRPASSKATARRSSRDLTSDTSSTTVSRAADENSIVAVLCSGGALKTLVWLMHSSSSAVAAAARAALLALLQHHTRGVCALVEQGCIPLLLMPCSSNIDTTASTAALEMATILQCLRSKLCGGELQRLLQTVKAPGNRELRSNVACGLALLFTSTAQHSDTTDSADSSTAAVSLQQGFVSSGALQAVVGMLRSSLYRPTGAAVLRVLAARTATLQPPAAYFSTAAVACAAGSTSADNTDATVLILEDKFANSSSGSSDSSSGIRMACPSAAVLQLASPALGRALAAVAATATATIISSTTATTADDADCSATAADCLLLPLLRGRYVAWEDIMAHIGAPAAAAAAVTRLTVPQLTELFTLTSAHGAAALADSYALELSRRNHAAAKQQQQQAVAVATAAAQRTAVIELVGVLEAALQCGHAWLCSEALKWLVAALGDAGQSCAGTPLQLNRLVTVLHSALTVLLIGEQAQQ